MLWCEGEVLHAALRSERELPYTYDILEENHHFTKEKEKFYRISKIYKATLSKTSGDMVEKTLIWDNHSEVMFDYGLIPKDQIRFS